MMSVSRTTQIYISIECCFKKLKKPLKMFKKKLNYFFFREKTRLDFKTIKNIY